MSEPDESHDEQLSVFEFRVVEAYMGEAGGVGARAVMMAGGTLNPRSAASTACEVLKRPHVQRALRERMENDPLVAGRLERLRFYTSVLRGQVNEVRTVLVRRGKGGEQLIESVTAPPSVADRMAAAAALAKAAGEHLIVPSEDDQAKLLALLAGKSVAELFELSRGGTTQ
jgi:hypothetical protein